MRNPSEMTASRIVLGLGAAVAVLSAVGCGATESTCKELQRTCGCDDRKPCVDGAAGAGGASTGGAGGMTGADASDDSAEGDGSSGAAGNGGQGGAGGSGGRGGTAGTSGAGGKAGAAGAAGSGGTRDDAAAPDAGGADRELDAGGPSADVSIDGSADAGGESDAGDENDVMDGGFDVDAIDLGPTCDITKLPGEDGCVIDEKYGVFVSPLGDDVAGSGTRQAPYATFAKALQVAAAQSLRVYACDEGTGYAEQLVVPDGAKIFGGFECIDWMYSTTSRAVVRAPASPALAIYNAVASGVLIEDIEVRAPDATAPATSSIGALVDSSANVVLRRMKIVAGKGGEGTAGANGAKGIDAPDVDAAQVGNAAVCPANAAAQLGGAWAQPSVCGSRGGAGGIATQGSDGSNGVPGTPRDNVAPPDVDNGGSKGAVGGDGIAGSPGRAGNAGMPTPMAGMFTSSGYTPAIAAPSASGTDGNVGQGGGGGGGSNATGMCIGASGGAGGMGGCGGKGGTGGSGGGASVALISWTSDLTLDTCELVAGTAGQGGKGGNGGAGGAGKEGAAGGAAFTGDGGAAVGKGGKGGTGGTGGLGGPGAGGTGGPSYALVYKAQAPVKTNVTLTAGTAGGGGPGGTSGPATAPDGQSGQAAPEFPVP